MKYSHSIKEMCDSCFHWFTPLPICNSERCSNNQKITSFCDNNQNSFLPQNVVLNDFEKESYSIFVNIRNCLVLQENELSAIKKFPKEKLIEIIHIYNLHIQNLYECEMFQMDSCDKPDILPI
jgi:hypothetical protein